MAHCGARGGALRGSRCQALDQSHRTRFLGPYLDSHSETPQIGLGCAHTEGTPAVSVTDSMILSLVVLAAALLYRFFGGKPFRKRK